jgi:cytochrome c oxidase subunit 2
MLAGAGLALAGCGRQSMLDTHGPIAHQISTLWWWMLVASAIVFFGTVGLLAISWFGRGKEGWPILGQNEHLNQGMVVLFGIGIPFVVLVALFGWSDVSMVAKTGPPNPKTTSLTINIIGHQWWWEVRYPGTSAITANEIHVPTNTRVDIVGTTADVIHDFWVPQLTRKVDVIPGVANRVLLVADRVGVYRGQCAEFCGFQHAHMGFTVVAQAPVQFRAWLANMSRPAGSTSGAQLFTSLQCASCHQIRGTSAHGYVGPDLTHLASRGQLAAAEIPNTRSWLARWITNPQAIKPGARMPDLGLTRTQVSRVVSYLETLK